MILLPLATVNLRLRALKQLDFGYRAITLVIENLATNLNLFDRLAVVVVLKFRDRFKGSLATSCQLFALAVALEARRDESLAVRIMTGTTAAGARFFFVLDCRHVGLQMVVRCNAQVLL